VKSDDLQTEAVTSGQEPRVLTLDNGGRRLEVVCAGPPSAPAVVMHSGTPSAPQPLSPEFLGAAAANGMQLITYGRPGYAGSSEQPGRVVADAAADVEWILDDLGISNFVTVGWSGGGPHALACAALLPERCLAVATVAGVGPANVPSLDFLAGMGEENQVEFAAACKGKAELTDWLEANAQGLATISASDVVASLGGLASEVDVGVLTGEFADWMAASFRQSVSTGFAGWRDDDLAFVAPWGFEPSAIPRPAFVWQGDQDRMVPYAHGAWLVEHMPSARSRLLPGEGHLSVVVRHVRQIIEELAGQL
jgi:pimeloyl-ACP methyl ester carboxylesterase